MNRRLGISILSVLSLTTGLLVAEHAFAPLSAPYPITGKPGPRSVAEPTASPREAAPPPAPADSTNQGQQPSERHNAAGEADGDPMVADTRPVIDSVWQNVDASATGGEATNTASAAVSAPAVTLASAGPAARGRAGFGGGLIGVGGSFSGERQARGSAGGGASGQGGSPATNEAAVVSATGEAPVSAVVPTATDPVIDAALAPALNPSMIPAMNPVLDPAATLAMNTPPSAPAVGMTDLGVPVSIPPSRLVTAKDEFAPSPPSLPTPSPMLPAAPVTDDLAPTTPPVPSRPEVEESLASLPPPAVTPDAMPDAMEEALAPAPPQSLLDVPADVALSTLSPVSVPEPLSGSLLLVGVLLGVLSHRRRRAA